MANVTRHLLITGRAQGVGYRYWAATTARHLGLVGWVRNLTDGRVEAVVQGSPTVIDSFVAACHAGPSLARVSAIDTKEAPVFDGTGFEQLPTVDAE